MASWYSRPRRSTLERLSISHLRSKTPTRIALTRAPLAGSILVGRYMRDLGEVQARYRGDVGPLAPLAGSLLVVLSFSHAPGLQAMSAGVKAKEFAYGSRRTESTCLAISPRSSAPRPAGSCSSSRAYRKYGTTWLGLGLGLELGLGLRLGLG